MDKKEQIGQYCQKFKTTGISTHLDQTIAKAEKSGMGFLDFTFALFKTEADHRHENELRKRLKAARLPRTHDLNGYDYTVENGLSKTRLNQLRELNWVDQGYNIMLMGPLEQAKRSWHQAYVQMQWTKDTRLTSEQWMTCSM